VRPALEPFERRQIEETAEIVLEEEPVRVAHPEETVVVKVLLGSDQDLQDARSIVVRQRERLEEIRLRELAREQGVLADVESLRREVREELEDEGSA